MLPSGPPPPLPPSMVTPVPSPPRAANGLALTRDTSAAALLLGLLPSLSAAAASDSFARPASTGSVLMTVCRGRWETKRQGQVRQLRPICEHAEHATRRERSCKRHIQQ